MCVFVSASVWKNGPVNQNQRFVLLAIADNADKEGFAFPYVETIAKKCVMTPRNVLRVLKMLVESGWISIVKRNPQSYKANAYQINLAMLSGDKASSDKMSGDDMSHDIAGSSKVTNTTPSGDIAGIPILKNVINRHGNVKTNTYRDKREEQTSRLFSEVKELIFRYYRSKNEDRDPEWDGDEGKHLSKLLKASPKADIDHWKRCLSNRYYSEETHGDRPMLWISRLSSYGNGPLNEFKKPLKEKFNGTTGSYSKAKSAGTQDALNNSLEREPDQDPAWEAGGEATDADRGGGFQDLQRRPYALPA
jgi:hypothetical protein